MDLSAVHVKNITRSPLLVRNSFYERPASGWTLGRTGISSRVEDGRIFEIKILKRKDCFKGYQPFAVKAMGKKKNDNSSSSGVKGYMEVPALCLRLEGKRGTMKHPQALKSWRNSYPGDGVGDNNSADGNKSDMNSGKSDRTNLDWREFRAKLFRDELKEVAEADAHNQGGTLHSSKPLGSKWAHPIPVPETGCVLVATEKLDGIRTFERSVVLLLRSGTRHPQEGPFGVIINRPLHKRIKNINPTNLDLATTFSDCPLHFGGPLEASMFLLRTGEKLKLPGFEEVIPGLCFGARNSLVEAAVLVKKGILKPQDFRFFVGYAGWQLDQLREEIESDYWHVAACSSSLLCGASTDSSENLWGEILQLMGGHYSELSRKPKQDI